MHIARRHEHEHHQHDHPEKRGGEAECEPCGKSDTLRTRYFYSMLLEADDLAIDQSFHLQNMRSHHSELHGYGTVCGLLVKEDKECPFQVEIKPGVAIDCLGRRIAVTKKVELDLERAAKRAFREKVKKEIREEGEHSPDQQRPNPEDPECWHGHVHLWIGICHREFDERPVQSLGGPETCCQPSCESSRVRDGWCLVVRDQPLPGVSRIEELRHTILHDLNPYDCKPDDVRKWICEWLTCECPRCEPDECSKDSPCLTLASLRVDRHGHVSHLDNCIRPFALPTYLLTELLLFAFERRMR